MRFCPVSRHNPLVTIKAQFTSDEWNSRFLFACHHKETRLRAVSLSAQGQSRKTNIAHYTSGSTRTSRFNAAGDFPLDRLFVFLDYPKAERETARSLQGNAVLFHSAIYNLEQKNKQRANKICCKLFVQQITYLRDIIGAASFALLYIQIVHSRPRN